MNKSIWFSYSTISIHHEIRPNAGLNYRGSVDESFVWKPVIRKEERFATASLLWYSHASHYRCPSIVSFGVVDVLDTPHKDDITQQRPAL